MRIAVLGPVLVDGQPIPSRRARAAVGALAMHAGRDLSTDQIIDAIWGAAPPRTAEKSLRNTVVELRRLLGPSALVTTPTGYRLTVDPNEIDVHEFESASPDRRRVLWRGLPYDDIADWAPAEAERARLSEFREVDREVACAVLIERGRHDAAIAELEALVTENPLREQRWCLLMLALYRAGRQRDALLAYKRLRDALISQVGIEPSAAARDLEARILRQDPSLDRLDTSMPAPLATALMTDWPMTGRDTAMNELAHSWERAKQGAAQVHVVIGESGAGKTRVVAELARQVEADGGTVLFGPCQEEAGEPFHPVATALRLWLSGQTLRPDLVSPALARIVPEFGSLPRRLDDDDPALLFDAVGRWLARLAENAPVMFVIDDMQWASPTVLAMLRQILPSLATSRLCWVWTTRSEALSVHAIGAEHHAVVTELAALSVDDVRLALAGHPAAQHAPTIHATTGGNAYLVTSAARHVADTGGIGLPIGTGWAIDRRVLELGEAAIMVLTVAAVIGLDFDDRIVAAASGHDSDDVLGVVERAGAAGLLRETGVDRWSFAHSLVRDHLLGRLSMSRRSRVHGAVAEALEHHHPDDVVALAHHFSAAGPASAPQARRYLVVAGDSAAGVLAFADAVQSYRRAIELGTPDASLLLALARAEVSIGDLGWIDHAHDACMLAIAADDLETATEALLVAPRFGAPTTGPPDQRWEPLLRSVLVRLDPAASVDRAVLLSTLGASLSFTERLVDRVALCREALSMLDDVDAPPREAVRVLHNCFGSLRDEMSPAERDGICARMVRIGQDTGDPVVRYMAAYTAVIAAAERGDDAEVERHLGTIDELQGDPRLVSLPWGRHLHRAWWALARNDLALAEQEVTNGYAVGMATGQLDAGPVAMATLFGIRTSQDRLAELAPLLGAFEATSASEVGRAMTTVAVAMTGDLDSAQAQLDDLLVRGLDREKRSVLWPAAIASWAIAAALVSHRGVAEMLIPELEPYAGRFVFTGASLMPPMDESLGSLCALCERWEDSDRWFANAHQLSLRAGWTNFQTTTELAWAGALAMRPNEAGAHARARTLLDSAESIAHESGAAGFLRLAAEVRATLAAGVG